MSCRLQYYQKEKGDFMGLVCLATAHSNSILFKGTLISKLQSEWR